MALLEDQPKRMAREQRLLLAHARSTPGFTLQGWSQTAVGELCLNFNLQLAVGNFNGLLVYPDMFPDVPAFIRPKKAGERWSRHQYGGSGVLCLQYGPDNWHTEITGVDLVRSANTLLWGEVMAILQPRYGTPPSRHTSTWGQDLRGIDRRLLVTQGMRHALAGSPPGVPQELKVVITYCREGAVAVPTAFGSPPKPIPDVPQAFAAERFEWSGWVVPVTSIEEVRQVKDLNSLKTILGPAWPWSTPLSDQLRPLLLHDTTGEMRAFVLTGGDEPTLIKYTPVDLASDAAERLPEAYGRLADLSVAVVGLGSLGSKIAVSLARAGVRRFLLVDDDVLAPDNLVRNELNWFDVGFSKVEATERELKRIAVGVDVATRNFRVAGQENPQLLSQLASDLAKCNMLVDATANPRAFVTLAAIAKRRKLPMVWGEIFGGGGGALMARSRPGLDADPLSVRSHIHGVMGTMAPIPEGSAKDYGLEAEGKTYVASDADVMALAAAMTQFALDIQCADEVTAYPVAAYLMGFRKYWEFRCPFDTIPIDCSGALQPVPESQQLTADEAADLAELTKAMETPGGAADNSSY